MKSANFEILRADWPELAALGGFAESYAHADPASALVKLRVNRRAKGTPDWSAPLGVDRMGDLN